MSAGSTTALESAFLPLRPLLPGLYHVVPVSRDRVLVANGGRTVALAGPGFADRVRPLLAALDGSATRHELEARFPELAAAVLKGLAAKGLLTDASPAADGATAPQLAALAMPGVPSPAEAVPALAGATIALAGCGPVAAQTAVLLAKAGVGRLVLSDARPVSARDVPVSAVLFADDEGSPRAEAVSACTQRAGVAADVVSGLGDLEGLDLVVLEAGYDKVAAAVADACLHAGVPYLLHTQDALDAEVGPLVAPGGMPCHHCLEARRLGHLAHPQEHQAYRWARAITSPGPDAFLAAHSAVVAGLVAVEALRAVLHAGPLSQGNLLAVELGTMDVRREPLLPLPGCKACAGAGQVP